jgi:uncharacterized phage protein (TIGR01671 family)
MREILFRAWDPLRNKMWKYAVPMFEGKINVSDRENGAFNEIIEGKLMQWTGLVDCKGNKIFEGDLVKWIIYDNGWDGQNFHLNKNKIIKQGIGVVYWSQDHLQIKGCKKSISSLTWSASKEVIGNRFQNPELIKE